MATATHPTAAIRNACFDAHDAIVSDAPVRIEVLNEDRRRKMNFVADTIQQEIERARLRRCQC